MIDLHCHLLPGIDDGASDMEAAIGMARVAVAGGVDAIVATPHVSATYRNDPLSLRRRVAEVQQALDAEGVALTVHPGAEVSHSMFSELAPEAVRACSLGDGNYLLLEPPYTGPAPFLGRLVDDLHADGFEIVIAHPERIGVFQRRVELLEELVAAGCLCSVTVGSVSGRFGGSVRRFTRELFARGLVHNLASDAHDAHVRSPALRPGLDRAVAELPELEHALGWLCLEVPRAILAGRRPSGDPPPIARKRGVFSRLLRRDT